ncbi:MAG TPA: STAS/SEC14 domain-containing protein [Thermoleophilaceae bacterium]
MIERLTDMPPGTLGYRATGRIERDDYLNVLVPDLRNAFESGGKLRSLYVIEDLDAIEPRALWEDTKLELGLGTRHHDQWERSAIVTDIDWMAHAARLFIWMIPGEARVFPVGELEAAKSWVAGGAP